MKQRKKKNKFKYILIILLVIIIVKIMALIIKNNIIDTSLNTNNQEKNNSYKVSKDLSTYSIRDLEKYLADEANEEIVILKNEFEKKYVIDDEKVFISININNYRNNNEYTIVYGEKDNLKEKNNISQHETVEIQFNEEGEHQCYVAVKRNGEIIDGAEWTFTKYYIRSYNKQFLDELENKGVGVHLIGNDLKFFSPLYKALGAQYIRVDLRMNNIYKDNEFVFDTYDTMVKQLLKENVNIIAILGSPGDYLGTDGMVSSDEELELFNKYVDAVAEHYPEITYYEIWNEPNAEYKKEQQIEWYAKTVNSSSNILKSKKSNIKILSGATSYGSNAITPTEFISNIAKYDSYKASDSFTFHIYDFSNIGKINTEYENKIKNNNKILNDLGGFIKNSNTEFGGSTYTNSLTEEQQATKLVQQYVLSDKYNIDFSMVYNFRDSGNNSNEKEDNFGLITCAKITPKKSYYSVKQYYQNTNGAEYIGTVNLADGLEAHVYDKDGKPKMVVWANDTTKNVQINYQNFTAKDLYGNNIENINGKLTITESPIYLENIDTKYLYQAISNTALEKYKEFQEKFAEQISMVGGLSTEIEGQKQYIKNITNTTRIAQSSSVVAMQNHYNLGNKLIQAYETKKLNIEYVKLSSMLDMLDNIGNSYEDLVTASATKRNTNIEETKQKIETAEKLIQDNEDLNIIYPSKILDYSKNYYEEAEYINGLEEENDIKTGLIVSKNLHASLLADWAYTFTDLYIDEYIGQNPVTIKYSIQEITNQNVTATLTTNANIQITNNSGKNEYIFENNGTFTFNYIIRGRQKIIETTVTNIDKTQPEIISVSGKIESWEKNKLTLIVNASDNLSGLSSKAYSFDDGKTWQEENTKTYTGNIRGIIIKVKDNLDNIATYEVINTTQIAMIVKPKTTVETFKNNIMKNEENIKIVDKNDNELNEGSLIKTGSKIKTTVNNEEISLTITVIGDINGDGQVNFSDILAINKHILNKVKLKDEYLLAGDINANGKVDFKDLLQMNKYRLGKIKTL